MSATTTVKPSARPREPRFYGLLAEYNTPGELLHASAYRNAAPYAGRDVLVVGVGNTGAEIAVDLVEGGAGRVRLAVRTPPHIMRRSTAGWPAQASGILVRRLPPRLVDRVAPYIERISVPDLSEYGLPRPETGLYARVLDGAIPVQDVVVRLTSVTQVPVVWSSRRSDEDCSDRTAWALPGFYHVLTAPLGGEKTDVQFELLAPAPPTVTETVEPGGGGKGGDGDQAGGQ